MLIQKNNSELYCEKCGNIKLLTGIVLDDSHYYMQEMGGRLNMELIIRYAIVNNGWIIFKLKK